MKFKKLFIALIGMGAILYISLVFIFPTIFFNKQSKINENEVYYQSDLDKTPDLTIIMDKVDSLLNKSPLQKTTGNKILICKNQTWFTFFALQNYSAFALNRPFFNTIVLSKTDFNKEIIIANVEKNSIRLVAPTLAHELMHKEITNHYGFFQVLLIPTWKNEGYCDYVAHESSYGFDRGITDLKAGKKEDSGSFDYFMYRLYVTYLIDYKKQSYDAIVNTRYNVKQLEKEILEKLNNGSFKP